MKILEIHGIILLKIMKNILINYLDMFIVSLTIIYIYYNNNYNIKNKLSKKIINYINSDIKLKSIFNHSLIKY